MKLKNMRLLNTKTGGILNKQETQQTQQTEPEVQTAPETTAQGQQEQDSSTASSQSTQHSTDHLDDLIGDQEEVEQETEAETARQNMLGADDFHALFCVGFSTASHLTGLKSLHVEKTDGSAKACTQALYDTITDIPALHFLLMPQNKWFERAFAIGSFTVPMAISVSRELAAPAAAQESENRQSQPEAPVKTLREMAAE